MHGDLNDVAAEKGENYSPIERHSKNEGELLFHTGLKAIAFVAFHNAPSSSQAPKVKILIYFE